MKAPEKLLLGVCTAALFIVIMGVFASPLFMRWEAKDIARYYTENGADETGSSNIVSAIVWDFRGFDTMGEETVLFTAAAGILAVVALNITRRKK
jgi:multisubunit Na+/H+ antiporter MnhB subunit